MVNNLIKKGTSMAAQLTNAQTLKTLMGILLAIIQSNERYIHVYNYVASRKRDHGSCISQFTPDGVATLRLVLERQVVQTGKPQSSTSPAINIVQELSRIYADFMIISQLDVSEMRSLLNTFHNAYSLAADINSESGLIDMDDVALASFCGAILLLEVLSITVTKA